MALESASNEIRDFLISLHRSYLPNTEAMKKAAAETGLSLSTVNQAVSQGKGSAVTHGLLICFGLQIKSDKLDAHLPKFKKIFAGAEKFTVLDEMIQKALKTYTVDEMIVWLELLHAKAKIEQKLGVKKKPGRPSKKSQ